MAHGPRCARSVRYDLEPNIFPSCPPTWSITTYTTLCRTAPSMFGSCSGSCSENRRNILSNGTSKSKPNIKGVPLVNMVLDFRPFFSFVHKVYFANSRRMSYKQLPYHFKHLCLVRLARWINELPLPTLRSSSWWPVPNGFFFIFFLEFSPLGICQRSWLIVFTNHTCVCTLGSSLLFSFVRKNTTSTVHFLTQSWQKRNNVAIALERLCVSSDCSS